MVVDVEAILGRLAVSRPIFHLEADFQHTLAWEIHREWPTCEMRLESKPQALASKNYIDVWAFDQEATLVLELKYKTRRLTTLVNGELFELVDQGGQPLYRYDFLKDVQRLEQLHNAQAGLNLYALFLTNESSYWTQLRSNSVIDRDFRIHDGIVLHGDLGWAREAGAGTTKGRTESINITGEYPLQWRDYSTIGSNRHGEFKYLLVHVA